VLQISVEGTPEKQRNKQTNTRVTDISLTSRRTVITPDIMNVKILSDEEVQWIHVGCGV
jgi:hypothetical protein